MKKVVICIPSYNAEATIARTLDSLVEQDYPIFKIKIFDNVSTDQTQKIISQYAEKHPFIELHVNEKNIGAEGNFTKCIQAAEGDYCALVHTDDIYNSNFLSKSVETLEKNHECVASFCGALEIDSSENVIGKRFYPKELENKDVAILDLKDLLSLTFKYANFITCPSVVVRSRVYSEGIKFWNGSDFKTSADLDVWLRLAQLGKLVGIKECLMRYRVANFSHSYRIAKKRTTRHDLFFVLDYYKKLFLEKLSRNDLENYTFLNLKDQALRSLNIVRNQKRDESFPREFQFNLLLVCKKMVTSKWHFKMGISILGIYSLCQLLILFGWKKHE